jgi:hypothetical protein
MDPCWRKQRKQKWGKKKRNIGNKKGEKKREHRKQKGKDKRMKKKGEHRFGSWVNFKALENI